MTEEAVKQSKSFLFRQHVLIIFCLGSDEVPSQVDSVELVHQVTKSSLTISAKFIFFLLMKTSDTFQEYIIAYSKTLCPLIFSKLFFFCSVFQTIKFLKSLREHSIVYRWFPLVYKECTK